MHPVDRRTFLQGSAAAVGALYLSSCGGGEEEEGQEEPVTLILPGEDVGLPSPFTYMRGPGYILTSYIYDTLLWKDASGEYLPWIASGYEVSEDGRMYTFTVRDGISWHDGRPLTAQDVAFTFEYFAEHREEISPTVIITPVPDIEEVRATDERTVEFRLSNPVATFLQFGGAGAVPIVPRHIWSSIDDPARASDLEVLVGSGPYRLEAYEPGQGTYLYTANDEHFLGRPVVRRIEYRPVDDELSALMAGQIDQASQPGLRPPALEPFRQNPELEVIEAPVGNNGFGLYWNLAEGGALADVRFRRACALAIDREEMVMRLFGGNATVGNPGWIPAGNPFHVDVEQYPYDPQAANRLLDEAGYERGAEGLRSDPDGEALRYTLLLNNERPMPAVELIVADLRELGVEVTPEALDPPTFNERVIMGASELSVISFGGMNTDQEPDYVRDVYSSRTQTTQHAQGYENEEFDRLAQEQLTTLDTAERMQIAARMQQIIASDLPLLPLVYPTSFTIVNNEAFDGWYYTSGGVGGTVPSVNNKHAFATGRETGLGI
ncbi:MAG: ABC transporter substrate-binding protein [Solirubrobacteraceae bacterium MAG38_C4-C5]|nr:ABC transporter substrate-binding protein [Candidatus Siliceabacter maunaloa]